MATKKTAAEQGLQQKMKVLAKLFDAGCKTEKDLKALTLPTILMQAIATSIDALAVGISFAVIHVNIFTACLLICGITFGLSLIGAAMGKRFGSMVKEKARVLGGVILILIGLRIFVEHMFF